MSQEGDIIFVVCPEPTCGRKIPIVFSGDMEKILCMACKTVGKIVVENAEEEQ